MFVRNEDIELYKNTGKYDVNDLINLSVPESSSLAVEMDFDLSFDCDVIIEEG